MHIRDKFTALLGIMFINVVVIVGLSLFAMATLERYQTTAERGTALITRSRSVFNLLKDLAITAFAPDTYGRLKDVFYYEKFDSTLRNWEEAVQDFQTTFHIFMEDPTIRTMVKVNPSVGDEYRAATTMSKNAFSRIASVMAGFHKLAETGYLSQEDSYQRIVSSSDQKIAGLFSEVRNTSYYLRNSFESFMNHFVNAVNKRVADTRSSITYFFLAATLLSVLISLSLSIIFGNRIIRNVRTIQSGMSGISRGDFSHHIAVTSSDELGELARNINSLADELKRNIDRLLHVTRDIGSGIDAETDLEAIRRVIVATASRETGAGGVALLPRKGSVMGSAPPVAIGLLTNPTGQNDWVELVKKASIESASYEIMPTDLPFASYSSMIICPLPTSTGSYGQLVAVTDRNAPPFTDLDFIVLQSYADFSALSIDNYLKYRELIELREAEYQSLQARIQPHFLYNVMNGLIGLNRMGEKAAVEAAILDLKDLLRYTLDHDRTVSLEEELGFVRKYLDLQKLRFGEHFDYKIGCAPSCAGLLIPKLLLQPLAENALIHGIELRPEPGLLEISATSDPVAGVSIRIHDNGAGFDPSIPPLSPRIGLTNVSKRLELAYPGSTFHIGSAPGKGCTVSIQIQAEACRI